MIKFTKNDIRNDYWSLAKICGPDLYSIIKRGRFFGALCEVIQSRLKATVVYLAAYIPSCM